MRKTAAIFALVASILASTASAQIAPFGTMSGGASNGAEVPGCSAITAIASVVSGTFTCNPASVANGTATTAGRSILTIRDTISGSSATSNFLNITGAFPATLSANANGAYVSVAADNDAWIQTGLYSTVTGTGPVSGAALGLWGEAAAASSAYNFGVAGSASGAGTTSVGVIGRAYAGTNRIGGYFALANQNPPATSAGIVVDNATQPVNIAEFRDNGTAVVTIADGGATTFTQQTTHSSGVVVGSNFALSSAGLGYLYGLTSLTPDAPAWNTATTSESLHFFQLGDNGFDFNNGACGTSACTDPGLIIHSAAQDTTQYNHQAAWGQAGGALKTLTESAATSVVRIPVAALEGTGGKLTYRVKAADATDVQIREGEIKFAVVNKAGTETCTLSGASEAADGSVVAASVGTLTYGITCDTTPANAVDIQFNAVSSLTQTTLNIQYFITLTGVGQPARQ